MAALILSYAPLAGGLLTGVEATKRTPRMRGAWEQGRPAFPPDRIHIAEKMDALGAEWGIAPAQLALAWLLARPAVATVVTGPETPEELDVSAGAADVELSPEQLEELSKVGADMPGLYETRGLGPRV